MKVLIQSDELAKDVASAESLLERHQEHKVNNILLVCKELLRLVKRSSCFVWDQCDFVLQHVCILFLALGLY